MKTEVEVRVGKLRNEKAAGKDEVTGEIEKGGTEMVVDWIWNLCNMAFESMEWMFYDRKYFVCPGR